jgi:4'-phosphopantetheinyl transferase EntD
VESAHTLRRIVDAATSILDRDVVVEAAAPAADLEALFPDERRYVEAGTWAPPRQREFAAARGCARVALRRLGIEPCALVPHADRSPRWPDGVAGSISHTRELCLVALARRGRIASLGIDVEHVASASPDIEQLVCTAAERRWLDAQAASQRARNVRLLFSAKEAFYKCQYPLTRTFLDFQEVELAIDVARRSFAVRSPELAGARGRWIWLDDLVITAAISP